MWHNCDKCNFDTMFSIQNSVISVPQNLKSWTNSRKFSPLSHDMFVKHFSAEGMAWYHSWNMFEHVKTCWNLQVNALVEIAIVQYHRSIACDWEVSLSRASIDLNISQQYTWHMMSHDLGWHPIQHWRGCIFLQIHYDTLIHRFCIRIDGPHCSMYKLWPSL